jgi:hypothetical protein
MFVSFATYFAPLELKFHIMHFIYKYFATLSLNPKLQSSMIFIVRMLHLHLSSYRVAELLLGKFYRTTMVLNIKQIENKVFIFFKTLFFHQT